MTIHPYYAKEDNGKHAYFMDADENAKRLFGIGALNDEGDGGILNYNTFHADRTRLRWVIEETENEAVVTSINNALLGRHDIETRFFNLQGIELTTPPQHGLFIIRTTDSQGRTVTHKILR